MATLDFDAAIKAHSQWKQKLSAYLKKPDGSLKPVEVEPDDRCTLGHWLRAEAGQPAALPELGVLKTEHTRFHLAAAEVVRRANAGRDVSEEILLGGASDFSTASSAVVGALVALRRKTQ
jgi:methyl-accepting chemotaxis protein